MHAQSELFLLSGLPEWLPGETLFSLASRYHALSGSSLSSSTCLQLFGSARQGLQHDFPSQLDEFARRTRNLLGTPIEIIRYRTILPFYLPFRSQLGEDDAIAAMRGNVIGSLKYRLGIITSRFRANHPLKACPECIKSDIEQFGIAYWHLSHQYPGIWTCISHNLELLEATEKSSGVGRFLCHLPSINKLARAISGEESLKRSELMLSLARIIDKYTTLPEGFRFDPQILLAAYSNTLKERGLMSKHGSAKTPDIADLFYRIIQPLRDIRELSALPSNKKDAATQIHRLLQSPRSGTHPLRHLTFIAWLVGDWDEFIERYQEANKEHQENKEPSAHPAAIAALPGKPHDAHRFLNQEFLQLLNDENYTVSQAAKQIGIDVITAMTWAAQVGISTARRPKKLKAEIRDRLIAEIRKGHNKLTIADRFEISVQTVTTTMRTEVGLYQAWLSAREELARHRARTDWERLAIEKPEASVKIRRAMAPATYAWLYRNDRAWLKAHTENRPSTPRHNNVAINWESRDAVLSHKVRKVALELVSQSSTPTISLWQLYQRLPELKAKLDRLDRLPLTSQAIAAVTRKRKQKNPSPNLL